MQSHRAIRTAPAVVLSFIAALSSAPVARAAVIITKTVRGLETDTTVATDDPNTHDHQEAFQFEPNLPYGSWSKSSSSFASAATPSGSAAGSASTFASQTSTVFVTPTSATFSSAGSVTASFTAAGPVAPTWTDPLDNHYFTTADSQFYSDFTLDTPMSYAYTMSTVFTPGAYASLYDSDASAYVFDLGGDQSLTGTLPAGHYRITINAGRSVLDPASTTLSGDFNGSLQLSPLPLPEPTSLLTASALAFPLLTRRRNRPRRA